MGAQTRFLLVLVAAAAVALAVWTWLPPTEASQEGMRRSILRYDLAWSLAWPADHSAQTTLPKAVRDELRAAWRASLGSVAEGDALALVLAFDPVGDLLAERRRQPDRVVVARGGDVAYFDVRRRTLRGTVIVRAAVSTWTEVGWWDAESGTVVRVARHAETSPHVYDYTLRQRGDAWRVVDRALPDDGHRSYDTETGEFGTGGG